MKCKLKIMKQRSALAKLKFSILNCQFSILLMIALFASPLKAQVTIGSQDVPQPFSILELTTKNKDGGLRLPHLTTAERDALGITTAMAKAEGLVIYNTDIDCVEFWSGSEWIRLCTDVLLPNSIQIDVEGRDNQTLCNGSVIAAITYSTTGATGATVTGLPAGVTGTWASNAVTISGTPTVSGTFNYTVTLTGGSETGTITGTITVNPVSTVSAASSSPTVVVNEAMTSITHTTTGATGIGTATGLPAGVSANFADNTITISGTPTAVGAGTFNYSIPLTGGCETVNATGTITVIPFYGAITTFTNVMYDFQHQTLEAYPTTGTVTGWRWQVSKISTGSFVDIPSAPNSNFYTVPANFADSYRDNASAKTDSLFFRCILTFASGDEATDNLNLLFIRTNTAGYSTLNGVRYLTIQKGKDGNNTSTTTGTMKIALANLGASEGDDAGDLGDFYQWGRIADGHEHIVWTKDSSHANVFGAGTSATVAKGSPTYTSSGQIPAGDNTYGKFISAENNDWGAGTTASNARWGNSGSNTTRASDISLSGWTYSANNPCPTGWRVPSRWNWWDIYNGTGSDTSTSTSNYLGAVNGWYWRETANNAAGGVIISNASGERVFLPAVGYRYGDGVLRSIGNGNYWSSTYSSTTMAHYVLSSVSNLFPGNSSYYRANGPSVRCVAE